MNTFFRLFIVFLTLLGAFTLATSLFDLEFGSDNYWGKHGVFFLLFITLFPRLTLLFSSVPFGGLFWWLGLIFAPRLTVAVLATLAYWEMNPVLVIISWVVAFSGESSEKVMVTRQVRVVAGGGAPWRSGSAPGTTTTIEGEYRRLDD
jgi:hypothetical protein